MTRGNRGLRWQGIVAAWVLAQVASGFGAPQARAEWSHRARAEVSAVASRPAPVAFETGNHATVWGAVRAYNYKIPGVKRPHADEIRVKLASGGEIPAVLGTQTVLGIIRKAPLAIVVPGMFGNPMDALAARWVSRYKDQGYHVVSLANPWSDEYQKVGPVHELGSIEKEAALILEAIRTVRKTLAPWTQGPVHVTGESYGGLLAAAAFSLQEKQFREKGWARPITGDVTILGPPYELSIGVERFDRMFISAWRAEDSGACDIDLLDELKLSLSANLHKDRRVLPVGSRGCADYLIARRFHEGVQKAAKIIETRSGRNGPVPARMRPIDFLKAYAPGNHSRLGKTLEGRLDYWVCSVPAAERRQLRMLAAEDDFLTVGMSPSFQDIVARGCPDGTAFMDSLFLPWGGHLGFEGQEWFSKFVKRHF